MNYHQRLCINHEGSDQILLILFLKIESLSSLSSNPTNENEMSVTSFLFWPIKLAFVVDKSMRVIKEKAKGYASEKDQMEPIPNIHGNIKASNI